MGEGESPNVEGLIRFARRYAEALALTPLSDDKARALIHRVLFGEKEAWGVFESGLITRDELTNLFLAHLETELGADGLGVDDPELFAGACRVLFGDAA